MTRADAANADGCLEGRFGRRSSGALFPLAGALVFDRIRAARRGRWLPSAASIGVVLALVGAIAVMAQHLRFERDLALSAGAREVDMRATLLAARLDAALAAAPQTPAAEIFRRVLDAHPGERLAEAVMIDRVGRQI